YMVARSNALFSRAPVSEALVATVGVVTALFAAIVAVYQYDIKRVLAYSTVSQLGYMFVGVGVGAYAAGVFHLVTHAFFKALLFLGAGSVIHGLGGEQDLRRMGGLAPRMLVTTVTVFVGAWGLAGLPPFARFLSPVLPFKEAEHGGVTALALAAVAVVVAASGVFLAWLMYGRRPVDPATIGVPRTAVHKLLLNKYYVDEIYDALIVQPIYRGSLWLARVFDPRVIDGLVNGVAEMILGWA